MNVWASVFKDLVNIQDPRLKLPCQSKVYGFPGRHCLFITTMTPEVEKHYETNVAINMRYARSQGYGFWISRQPLVKDRFVTWDRIDLIEEGLKQDKYQYVVYIDADVIVRDLPILTSSMWTHDVFMYKDPGTHNHTPCNGIIVLNRDSGQVRQLIDKWKTKREEWKDNNHPFYKQHPREQGAFNEVLKENKNWLDIHVSSDYFCGGHWYSKNLPHFMTGPLPHWLKTCSTFLMKCLTIKDRWNLFRYLLKDTDFVNVQPIDPYPDQTLKQSSSSPKPHLF